MAIISGQPIIRTELYNRDSGDYLEYRGVVITENPAKSMDSGKYQASSNVHYWETKDAGGGDWGFLTLKPYIVYTNNTSAGWTTGGTGTFVQMAGRPSGRDTFSYIRQVQVGQTDWWAIHNTTLSLQQPFALDIQVSNTSVGVTGDSELTIEFGDWKILAIKGERAAMYFDDEFIDEFSFSLSSGTVFDDNQDQRKTIVVIPIANGIIVTDNEFRSPDMFWIPDEETTKELYSIPAGSTVKVSGKGYAASIAIHPVKYPATGTYTSDTYSTGGLSIDSTIENTNPDTESSGSYKVMTVSFDTNGGGDVPSPEIHPSGSDLPQGGKGQFHYVLTLTTEGTGNLKTPVVDYVEINWGPVLDISDLAVSNLSNLFASSILDLSEDMSSEDKDAWSVTITLDNSGTKNWKSNLKRNQRLKYGYGWIDCNGGEHATYRNYGYVVGIEEGLKVGDRPTVKVHVRSLSLKAADAYVHNYPNYMYWELEDVVKDLAARMGVDPDTHVTSTSGTFSASQTLDPPAGLRSTWGDQLNWLPEDGEKIYECIKNYAKYFGIVCYFDALGNLQFQPRDQQDYISGMIYAADYSNEGIVTDTDFENFYNVITVWSANSDKEPLLVHWIDPNATNPAWPTFLGYARELEERASADLDLMTAYLAELVDEHGVMREKVTINLKDSTLIPEILPGYYATVLNTSAMPWFIFRIDTVSTTVKNGEITSTISGRTDSIF